MYIRVVWWYGCLVDDLIGETGHVTVRIVGGPMPGEVQLKHNGFTHKYVAYADAEIPRDTEVWVVANRGGHAVEVRPA